MNPSNPLTPAALSEAIESLGREWLQSGQAESLTHINQGSCIAFAKAVSSRLQDAGWNTASLVDVELANFLALEEDMDGGVLDRALLAKHWPEVRPPAGLTWDHLEQLAEEADWRVGTHIWLTFEGKHYDAECPGGVANFLELPFFSTGIHDWAMEKRLLPHAPAPAVRKPRP